MDKTIRISYSSDVSEGLINSFIGIGIEEYLDKPIIKGRLERFSNFGGGSGPSIILTIVSDLLWGGLVQPAFYDILKSGIKLLLHQGLSNESKNRSLHLKVPVPNGTLDLHFKNITEHEAVLTIDKAFEFIKNQEHNFNASNQPNQLILFNHSTKNWEPHTYTSLTNNPTLDRYAEIREEAKKHLSS